MANSTALITDAAALAGSTPTAASATKALTAAGRNQDLTGNCSAVFEALTEARRTLLVIKDGLDAADPMLTKVNSLLGTLA